MSREIEEIYLFSSRCKFMLNGEWVNGRITISNKTLDLEQERTRLFGIIHDGYRKILRIPVETFAESDIDNKVLRINADGNVLRIDLKDMDNIDGLQRIRETISTAKRIRSRDGFSLNGIMKEYFDEKSKETRASN